MKLFSILACCLLAMSCTNKYAEIVNAETDYQIIPKPVSLNIENGRFLVNNKTAVQAPDDLKLEATYLSEMLSLASGFPVSCNNSSGSIVLKIDNSITNDEGYKLSVNYKTIEISGKTGKGVFYGIQSLRQLLPASAEKGAVEGELTIPAVVIEDSPRYGYRGMHLDVSRYFYPVDFVKKYIDLIALHKMNTFHWHLTDDQGWRIEIKKYPKLTEVGAFRNGTLIGHYPGEGNDQTPYGGFYTQEDVKDVVAYAAERHVTVIPEIEMPGHASAAIAAYPYLSCFPEKNTVDRSDMLSEKSKALQAAGTPKVVYESWGVVSDVFCAGKDETFALLEGVLEEVMPLFPSAYIHIGGDECPKTNWKACPHCQKRIKELGLKDEHELQSYFVQRMEKFVNSKGKKIIGWDEILEGGLAPNATVMSWRGIKGGIEAAKQKHDVIMTPTNFCYFDYYQSEDKENEPMAICCYIPVEKVYGFDPTPEALAPDEQKHILGAQGNLWTEYISASDYVEYMALPRMTALSEVVWTQKEQKNWDDFKTRLNHLAKRYDILGVNYGKHLITAE
ncbi:MAG: beta-N-acetylhexosaminidase [Flavobacteriaceae bacterium]